MLTASRLIAFVLVLVLGTGVAMASSVPSELAPDLKKASHDPRWLNAYLYEKRGSDYRSDVNSQRFFFAEDGPSNPASEMKAAFEAFTDTRSSPAGPNLRQYGTLKLPAACAFPARRRILEKILNHSFPKVSCPDLDAWTERIAADQVSLVFVGAYSGNAASILGHTFFRFANSKREASGRAGLDLLSLSAGYLAQSDPHDGRMNYALKGLTGGYPGFYDIEPYYMKVGLYNNAESRDLWDVKLNLTPDEVHLLVQILWEYSFNAEVSYFFIGKNCSYRLLSLLEIVRPEAHLTENFWFEVLPAETVRLLIDKGMATGDQNFRSSIQRRLELKKSLLSPSERQQFQHAATSEDALVTVTDSTIMDALLDHWLFENYKVQTQLPEHESQLMEATYKQALKIDSPSRFQESDSQIAERLHLKAPFEGHRPHWVEVDVGRTPHSTSLGSSIHTGVHPHWSNDPGYRDISSIEYLGVDYRERQTDLDSKTRSEWTLQLVRSRTLEEFFADQRQASWGLSIEVTNLCAFCDEPTPQLQASASYGLSTELGSLRLGLLPDLMGIWGQDARLAPGIRGHLQWGILNLEHSSHFSRGEWSHRSEARLSHGFTRDHLLQLKLKSADLREAEVALSWVQFF